MDELEGNEQPSEVEEEVSEPEEIEEGKVAAVLAYVPALCFIPLLRKKHNRFAVEHGRQGLLLFIVEIIALVFLIPIISRSFWIIVLILCLIAALVGIVFAIQGRFWKIPLIGEWAEKLKI